MKVYIVLESGCVCGVYASKVDAHREARRFARFQKHPGVTKPHFYDVLERTVVKKSARKLP